MGEALVLFQGKIDLCEMYLVSCLEIRVIMLGESDLLFLVVHTEVWGPEVCILLENF